MTVNSEDRVSIILSLAKKRLPHGKRKKISQKKDRMMFLLIINNDQVTTCSGTIFQLKEASN